MFSSAKNSEGTPSTFVMKGPKNGVIITNNLHTAFSPSAKFEGVCKVSERVLVVV